MVSAATLKLKHELYVKPGGFAYYSSCRGSVTDAETGKPVKVDRITSHLRHESRYPDVNVIQVNSAEAMSEFEKHGWGSYWIVAFCKVCAESKGHSKWCTTESSADPREPQ